MGNTLDDERNRLLHSMSVPLSFVLIMWTVKIIEVLFHLDLSCLGLMPLKVEGLTGIFFFHFLHGSWKHLLTNTVPLLVLGACLYYFYRPLATRVWLLLMLSTGLLTWCGARGGIHIGASALIYGLAFFLMLSGFIRRNRSLIVVSLIVVFLYGSLVWGLYPKYSIANNISWEGHLSGFVMGVALAIIYRHDGPQKEEDDIQDDDVDDDDPFWEVPEPPKEDLTVPRYPKGFRRF